jgi:hypothetical protein
MLNSYILSLLFFLSYLCFAVVPYHPISPTEVYKLETDNLPYNDELTFFDQTCSDAPDLVHKIWFWEQIQKHKNLSDITSSTEKMNSEFVTFQNFYKEMQAQKTSKEKSDYEFKLRTTIAGGKLKQLYDEEKRQALGLYKYYKTKYESCFAAKAMECVQKKCTQ